MPHVSSSSWGSDFRFCDRNPASITRTYVSSVSRAQQADSELGENQKPAGSAEAAIWKQKASHMETKPEFQHVQI